MKRKTFRFPGVFKASRPRKKRQPEQAFQKSLIKTLALVMEPNTFMFAVPNGGKRPKREAAIFAGLGVMPGVPDLVFFHDGRAACLELKSDKGRVDDKQAATIARIQGAGVPVWIVRTLPEALRALRVAGIPLRMPVSIGHMPARDVAQ